MPTTYSRPNGSPAHASQPYHHITDQSRRHSQRRRELRNLDDSYNPHTAHERRVAVAANKRFAATRTPPQQRRTVPASVSPHRSQHSATYEGRSTSPSSPSRRAQQNATYIPGHTSTSHAPPPPPSYQHAQQHDSSPREKARQKSTQSKHLSVVLPGPSPGPSPKPGGHARAVQHNATYGTPPVGSSRGGRGGRVRANGVYASSPPPAYSSTPPPHSGQ